MNITPMTPIKILPISPLPEPILTPNFRSFFFKLPSKILLLLFFPFSKNYKQEGPYVNYEGSYPMNNNNNSMQRTSYQQAENAYPINNNPNLGGSFNHNKTYPIAEIYSGENQQKPNTQQDQVMNNQKSYQQQNESSYPINKIYQQNDGSSYAMNSSQKPYQQQVDNVYSNLNAVNNQANFQAEGSYPYGNNQKTYQSENPYGQGQFNNNMKPYQQNEATYNNQKPYIPNNDNQYSLKNQYVRDYQMPAYGRQNSLQRNDSSYTVTENPSQNAYSNNLPNPNPLQRAYSQPLNPISPLQINNQTTKQPYTPQLQGTSLPPSNTNPQTQQYYPSYQIPNQGGYKDSSHGYNNNGNNSLYNYPHVNNNNMYHHPKYGGQNQNQSYSRHYQHDKYNKFNHQLQQDEEHRYDRFDNRKRKRYESPQEESPHDVRKMRKKEDKKKKKKHSKDRSKSQSSTESVEVTYLSYSKFKGNSVKMKKFSKPASSSQSSSESEENEIKAQKSLKFETDIKPVVLNDEKSVTLNKNIERKIISYRVVGHDRPLISQEKNLFDKMRMFLPNELQRKSSLKEKEKEKQPESTEKSPEFIILNKGWETKDGDDPKKNDPEYKPQLPQLDPFILEPPIEKKPENPIPNLKANELIILDNDETAISGPEIPNKDLPNQLSKIPSQNDRTSQIQEDKIEEIDPQELEQERNAETPTEKKSEEEETDEFNFENRYFIKNPTKLCFRCHKVGHYEKTCTEELIWNIRCLYCLGEHRTLFCDAIVCFKCSKMGHKNKDCPLKFSKNCNNCNKTGHDKHNCGVVEFSKNHFSSKYQISEEDTNKLRCYCCLKTGENHVNCKKIIMGKRKVDDLYEAEVSVIGPMYWKGKGSKEKAGKKFNYQKVDANAMDSMEELENF